MSENEETMVTIPKYMYDEFLKISSVKNVHVTVENGEKTVTRELFKENKNMEKELEEYKYAGVLKRLHYLFLRRL